MSTSGSRPTAKRGRPPARSRAQVFRELGSLGLLGMRHPLEYGGGGLGAMSSVVLAEELSRSSFGGVASSLTVHSDMSISHIAHRGTPAQKEKYLPAACAGEKVGAICVTEPGAGSDVAGLRTRAVRANDGWVLKGSKTYITNGVLGDIYIVAARTDPEAAGARGISLFIVERGTPGLSVGGKTRQTRLAQFGHGGVVLPRRLRSARRSARRGGTRLLLHHEHVPERAIGRRRIGLGGQCEGDRPDRRLSASTQGVRQDAVGPAGRPQQDRLDCREGRRRAGADLSMRCRWSTKAKTSSAKSPC